MPIYKPMQIVIASQNEGKIKEFKNLFSPLAIEIIPQTEFNLKEAPETASTFIENALIKARHACAQTGLPAIADDSGLVVEALDGAPGVYSARYAGLHANANENCNKLLSALQNHPHRQAYFYCCLVYLANAADPTPLISEGYWHGEILLKATGTHGFGYDPIFYVPSEKKSAAELPIEIKNKISHRAIAAQALLEKIKLLQILD